MIDAKHIREVLDIAKNYYTVSDDAEITIEVNPGTVDSNKLEEYKRSGINRLSIGLQSTHDRLLKELGRIHTYDDFLNTYNLARKIGFDNINVDLMLGLPGQSIQDLEESIDEIIKLNPEHVSTYSLIIEEGTPFEEKLNKNEIVLPDEDSERKMYWEVKNKLEEAGYIHYEISNFCLPGRHSRHNTAYWQNKPYLGCGASAHSYNLATRQWNVRDITAYIDGVTHERVYYEVEQLDTATRYNEYVMVSLRTMWGADTHVIASRYGQEFADLFVTAAEKHISGGCLAVEGTIFRLTRHGILLSDGVISDLMCVV